MPKRPHDPNFVSSHPRPFVSKQTRGERGRKQKPGRPTQPKVVHGPQQFYWHEYVWRTKKEMRDRIKQLLLSCAPDGTTRPPHPGGIKWFYADPPPPTEKAPVVMDASHGMFALLSELVAHHPNYANWAPLVAFRVVRAPTRKRPPVLQGRFKGSDVWRDLEWRKCVYKRTPTPSNAVFSAMWQAVSSQLEPVPPPPERALHKQSWPCERCGVDRLHIDQVHPSHTVAFHVVAQHYLAQNKEPRVQWVNHLNSFRCCDATWAADWALYHAEASQLHLLCETCRIQLWVESILLFIAPPCT